MPRDEGDKLYYSGDDLGDGPPIIGLPEGSQLPGPPEPPTTETGSGVDTGSTVDVTFTIPGLTPSTPPEYNYGNSNGKIPAIIEIETIGAHTGIDFTGSNIPVANPSTGADTPSIGNISNTQTPINNTQTPISNAGVVTNPGSSNTSNTSQRGLTTVSNTTPGNTNTSSEIPGSDLSSGNRGAVNFLSAPKSLGVSIVPFKLNHRYRGARESTKYLLFKQKLQYIFFTMLDLLRFRIEDSSTNLLATYPSNEIIQDMQHNLIQVKFYEDVRGRKIKTRWFN
jgi:hypothetical protein